MNFAPLKKGSVFIFNKILVFIDFFKVLLYNTLCIIMNIKEENYDYR